MLQFSGPIRVLLLQTSKEPLNVNDNDEHCEALISRQETYAKNNDTHKDATFFSMGSTVVVQREDMGPWMHGVIVEGESDYHLR